MTSLTNVLSIASGALLFLLKLVGFALLGILCVLIIAMFIPVSVDFLYEKSRISLMLRVLFLKFRVIDPERKKTEKKPDEQKSEQPETERASQKKASRKFDFEFIQSMVSQSARAARKTLKGMRMTDIDTVIVVSGGDPGQIGAATGRTWAALGNAMTLFAGLFGETKYKRLDVIPDFMAQHGGEGRFGCTITALPIVFIAAGIIFMRSYFIQRKAAKIRLKPVANNE